MEILDGYIEKMSRQGDEVLPGELAFKLYDTYGFPLDLTAEILDEQGLHIDRDGFESNLKMQQERARKASRAVTGAGNEEKYKAAAGLETEFTGYETLKQETKALFLLVEDESRSEAVKGDKIEIILDKTPFYAEAGGQIGDIGMIEAGRGRIAVENTFFSASGQIIHRGVVEEGKIAINDSVKAIVEGERRRGICRSHTSTHLLHRALRNRLGDHVNQAGSLVAPDRIRFDFNHFAALNREQLLAIEEEVNKIALENVTVRAEEKTLEEAKELGATALFADKYEESSVRMVSAGDYTHELCGGTHVSSTGEIGLFKIASEEGIGSGLRRIEATVGMAAYRQTIEKEEVLQNIALMLSTTESRLDQKFNEHWAEYKQLLKSNQDLKQRLAATEVKSLMSALKKVDGVNVLSASVTADSIDSLRMAMDEVKSSVESVVVVLGSVSDDKVMLVGSVSPDLVKRGIHANKIIKEVARQVGGGGGGKPELAQAGGKDVSALPAAIESVEGLVREQLEAVS